MSSKSSSFNSRRTFNTSHGAVDYYAISVLEDAGLIEIAKTPYSIRVLLENTLRKADEGLATKITIIRLGDRVPKIDPVPQ